MSVAVEVRNPTTNTLVSPTASSTAVTVATTGNTDALVVVPADGVLDSADFTSISALAAHDTNFITFSITNLGTGGAGATALLAASDANTTKATGGSALTANARRQLTLHGTQSNLRVTKGDVLRIRFAASGTLAGTVLGSLVQVRIDSSR